MSKPNIIALIPARAGSKRIPHKNIKLFCGKPIIAYPIITALESQLFSRVIVSTDSSHIASIARDYGAQTPFLRPQHISDDTTPTSAVVRHAISWLNNHASAQTHINTSDINTFATASNKIISTPLISPSQTPTSTQSSMQISPQTREKHSLHPLSPQGAPLASSDIICVIYPASPLLQKDALRQGLEALLDSAYAYSFSVESYSYNPYRSFHIYKHEECFLSSTSSTRFLPTASASSTSSLCANMHQQSAQEASFHPPLQPHINMLFPEHYHKRTQDLPRVFHDAGQFYFGRVWAWEQELDIFAPHSYPIEIPSHLTQDIDTLEDWRLAEMKYRTFINATM